MEGSVQRCDRCGVVSDLADGFVRRPTLAGPRTFCVACRRRRGRSSGGGLLVLVVLATPVLALVGRLAWLGRLDVLWYEPAWVGSALAQMYRTAGGLVAGEAPVILAALLLVIVVHEAGHALAAVLAGDHVAEVSVGLGPVVVRGRLGGMHVVLRALPFMGHTMVVPAGGAGSRLREAVHLAAGPLAHAGLVAAVLFSGASGSLAGHVVWFGGAALLLNLLPFGADEPPSDGFRLFQLARGARTGWEGTGPLAAHAYSRAVASHLARDLGEARRWCERGLAAHPADTATDALLIAVLLEQGHLQEARRRALALLAADLPATRRIVTECNLAYADLLLDDPALVPEAAEAVARASATLPWEPAVQASSAFLAIVQGRTEDGMALVSRALETEDAPSQRAGMLAVRAIGYARAGRFREADADVRAATRLSAEDVLVPRAVAEIARCRELAAGSA